MSVSVNNIFLDLKRAWCIKKDLKRTLCILYLRCSIIFISSAFETSTWNNSKEKQEGREHRLLHGSLKQTLLDFAAHIMMDNRRHSGLAN